MLIKVVAVQARIGRKLSLEEKLCIFKERPDFVCLPEYYPLDETVSDYSRAALQRNVYLQYLTALSDQLATCLIAGTVVEADEDKLYNTCYLIDRGRIVGSYRKRNPTPAETVAGISPGGRSLTIDIDGVRVGILICADVFDDKNYRDMADCNVDLVFVPTVSPLRPADSLTGKRLRDREYFLEGAETAGAYVVKVCGVGAVFRKPLQGRSLIAAPWAIVARVESFNEMHSRILTATLDIAELREFREKLRRSTADCRGPEASEVSTGPPGQPADFT
jgi:predicted amidohydrolase